MAGNQEIIDALKVLGPFEIVRSDSVLRLCPGLTNYQTVGTSHAWAVSQGERSAHKIKAAVDVLNKAIQGDTNA